MATWTRKTYDTLADVIHEATMAQSGNLSKLQVITHLCQIFKKDNPNFDSHRFLDACEFGDHT